MTWPRCDDPTLEWDEAFWREQARQWFPLDNVIVKVVQIQSHGRRQATQVTLRNHSRNGYSERVETLATAERIDPCPCGRGP